VKLRAAIEILAAVLLGGAAASGADFSMSTIIRAGQNGAAWELGIGPGGSGSAIQANVTPYYRNNRQHAFQIGYASATNSAYVRLRARNGVWQQATYSAGGAGLGASALWTIPATSLYVSAFGEPRRTSVRIANLSLGSGLTVLSGLSTTTLVAAQRGTTVTSSLSAPVIFRTGASGDWVLNGMVTFAGLGAARATLSDLTFGFGAQGTSTPEAATSTMLLTGMGLFGVGAWTRRKRLRPSGQ
jgi:hypothetical protein